MANETARRLRRDMTVDERKLWNELRDLRRIGFHFRRQAPIGRYIVDFVCFSRRLVVEVDDREAVGGVRGERPAAALARAHRAGQISPAEPCRCPFPLPTSPGTCIPDAASQPVIRKRTLDIPFFQK